ncbi:MAG: tetratricopeptide repeat protein [Methyloceanibacter sp.]
MRTCDIRVIGAFAALLVLAPAAVGAEDVPTYASATDAYREGMADISAGHTETALPSLAYAAERRVLGAQLELARLYAAGTDVAKDDAKAFTYYQQIADQRAEINPRSPISSYVAEAFVALGHYYQDGLPAISLPADPVRAAGLYRHAASYFGDPDAQYALGRLYLAGEGVDKNTGLAANWLAMAAKKQYAAAQATLGELLWHGDDIRARPAKGLALIMLAHENAKADGKEPDWIAQLYLDAIASADAATRKEARALVPELGGTFAAAAPATGIDRPADAAGDAGEGASHPAVTMEMPVGFAKGAEAPKPKP